MAKDVIGPPLATKNSEPTSRRQRRGRKRVDLENYPEDALIARWIVAGSDSGDPIEAVALPRRVPVWAIIGQLKLEYWKPEVVAGEYDLPLQAVETAVLFYRRNQEALDQRVAANRAFFRE